jgi:hypothetical protein
MKKSIFLSVVVFFALLVVPVSGGKKACAQESSVSAYGTVSGRIFRSDTGKGYAEVPVVLNWKPSGGQILLFEKHPHQTTKTDSDGNFKFENVTPTRYCITARVNYKPGERPPCGYFKDRKINDGNRVGLRKNVEGQTYEHILGPTFEVEAGDAVVKNFDMKCRLGSRLWPF